MLQTIANPEVHPFITNITAEDLAAVSTFVRNEFGDGAAVVRPDQVTEILEQ